jgi:predicted anti-sigma-YlaC factor YlaD
MKCINEELIQKYVDKECTSTEISLIQKHKALCEDCSRKIEEFEQRAAKIKSLLSILNEEDIKIPKFEKPTSKPKRLYLTIIATAVSVASIVIFGFFVFAGHEKQIEPKFNYVSEYNANLPIEDQEVVIQIIDSEGNVEEW